MRTTYADKRVTQASGPCLVKTPCGRRCCLNNGIRHELHCCSREACLDCHGPERYRLARLAKLLAEKAGTP